MHDKIFSHRFVQGGYMQNINTSPESGNKKTVDVVCFVGHVILFEPLG